MLRLVARCGRGGGCDRIVACSAAASALPRKAARPGGQAVPRGHDLHGHPGHRPERRRHARRSSNSITKPGAEIHDYQPTPARHRQGAVGRPRAVERHEPGALVRALLREREERAERGGHRRHRAARHPRGALHRQAQPARLDVAGQRADLRREHPQGAGQARSRPTPRPTRRTPRAYAAQIKAHRRAAAPAPRRHSRGPALAGDERGRVQLSRPRLRAARSSTSGRSTPTSRARRSRCAA